MRFPLPVSAGGRPPATLRLQTLGINSARTQLIREALWAGDPRPASESRVQARYLAGETSSWARRGSGRRRGGSRADRRHRPQSAAEQATTVEPGAVAPAVVALTDAGTIAVDASLGNDFRVTIGGNRTMGTPANPADGQKITFQVTQGTGRAVHAQLG